MYQSAVFPFYKGGRLLGPRPLELLELSKSTQSTYGRSQGGRCGGAARASRLEGGRTRPHGSLSRSGARTARASACWQRLSRSAPHSRRMPPLFITPNTVELVPTLGALFPRCGPVQDPVHASLLCEPRRVSCEGLHPQDMCAALGARATVSRAAGAVATTAPPLLLSHVTRGDTPPHPRFPPTRLRERVLY